MDPISQFQQERQNHLLAYSADQGFQALTQQWLEASMRRRYVYNFDWLGRPIIQYPQDMVAMQDLIWRVKPDLVIETGIAHGGSLVLSASMLAMLDYCEAVEQGTPLDPRATRRRVIGVDIDIRPHNRAAIEAHPLAHMIRMVQGSSIDPGTVEQVRTLAAGHQRVMVCLDSMHTHDHVLAELNAYAPLTSVGSYCVVFDTFVEDMPNDLFPDRPWAPGNNPKTAVKQWLQDQSGFVVDSDEATRLMVTVAPHGFLKRVA